MWRGPRETLAIDDPAGLYAWRCADAEVEAVIVLHHADGELDLVADLAEGWVLRLATDDGARLDGARLRLPPFSGAVLMAAGPAGARVLPPRIAR